MLKKVIALLEIIPAALLKTDAATSAVKPFKFISDTNENFRAQIFQKVKRFYDDSRLTPLRNFELSSVDEIVQNLFSPELYIRKTKKYSESIPKDLPEGSYGPIIKEYLQAARKLVNVYLSKDDRVKLFYPKILPYLKQINRFAEKITNQNILNPPKLFYLQGLISGKFSEVVQRIFCNLDS